ncbi:MAG TPA: isoprenylcysteine carboxylmethyltransferase family protein [Rhizomicrobium sp.]|nr:isoprenylcysteine carboxylmethyltransferase family protein [Rhizomicrobium sp.]
MIWVWVIIGFVALQRLAELPHAERNTRALMARGAVEIGRAHYPYLVVLHVAWLITVFLALPSPPVIHALPLAAYIVLQVLRAWTLISLGPYWTTRIITLPGVPLVKRGPYRFMRHPNYAIVVAEIAVLPLVFGEWQVAVIFSILNAIVLFFRIREEERALDARRALPVH